MLKYKILWFLFNVKLSLCNCHTEIKESGFSKGRKYYKVSRIARMPQVVNEGSGLVKTRRKETLFTLNDGGNKPELYEVDLQGNLLTTLPIPNAKNIDWEDLTQDIEDNLYIGDFGNNANNRKDLVIYKINKLQLINKVEVFEKSKNIDNETLEAIQKINFHYATQDTFPARNPIFDCEAFFWHRDSLYLFSKNRGNDHLVRMYALPAHAGNYVAIPKDSIYIKTMVTGAALSPNGQTFALLTYGKVFLFGVSAGSIDFRRPTFCIKLAKKQAEAITFLNDSDLLVSNEQREIFRLRLKN